MLSMITTWDIGNIYNSGRNIITTCGDPNETNKTTDLLNLWTSKNTYNVNVKMPKEIEGCK